MGKWSEMQWNYRLGKSRIYRPTVFVASFVRSPCDRDIGPRSTCCFSKGKRIPFAWCSCSRSHCESVYYWSGNRCLVRAPPPFTRSPPKMPELSGSNWKCLVFSVDLRQQLTQLIFFFSGSRRERKLSLVLFYMQPQASVFSLAPI